MNEGFAIQSMGIIDLVRRAPKKCQKIESIRFFSLFLGGKLQSLTFFLS